MSVWWNVRSYGTSSLLIVGQSFLTKWPGFAPIFCGRVLFEPVFRLYDCIKKKARYSKDPFRTWTTAAQFSTGPKILEGIVEQGAWTYERQTKQVSSKNIGPIFCSRLLRLVFRLYDWIKREQILKIEREPLSSRAGPKIGGQCHKTSVNPSNKDDEVSSKNIGPIFCSHLVLRSVRLASGSKKGAARTHVGWLFYSSDHDGLKKIWLWRFTK